MNSTQIRLATIMLKTKDIPENYSHIDLKESMDCLIRKGIILNTASFGNPYEFCLTATGDELSIKSEKEIRKSLTKAYGDVKASKSFYEHFVSWYGILGTTITLIGFWILGWQVWGWWFLGL